MSRFALLTGNLDKWREAERILGRSLERVEPAVELPEIQAATTREVAIAKAIDAHTQIGRAVIVEDTGLELGALGSFPGPFIKFWEKLGGMTSICRALDGTSDRSATAVCTLAWVDGGQSGVVEGRTNGTISVAPRGDNGFGWDVIFIPTGTTRTFAEMSAAEKDEHSHRRRAWDQLAALLR